MNRDTAILQISIASTWYNLPTTIIKRYKAKSKTNHVKKQIQKRNMNGEGGHLADANGSRRNVKFGSLQYFKFQQLPQDITCQPWYFIITKRNPKPNILRDKYKNAIWRDGGHLADANGSTRAQWWVRLTKPFVRKLKICRWELNPVDKINRKTRCRSLVN
jgi:hypothetical protein